MLIIDPAGCECIDCILGDSKPADKLTEHEKDAVAWQDKLTIIDRTGYSERGWERYLKVRY